MNRSNSLLAAGLLMVTVAACSDDESGSNTPLATTTIASSGGDTTAAPVEGGDAFVDPDGRFSIVFPMEPTSTPGSAPVDGGETVDFVSYIAGDSDVAYVTGCVDYEASGITDVVIDLEGARDGALSNVGATLSSSSEIELQGREGIEFAGTAVAGTVTGRMFIDGKVLCQVVVIGGEDAVINAFLDSFQFLEPAP